MERLTFIMQKLKWINVALRAVMEIGIVTAFGFWGYRVGNSTLMKILLAIAVPMAGFGFWGAVDFHQLGSAAEFVRLVQELILSILAAFAFYISGLHTLAWILFVLSAIHHSLIYILGDRLIKKNKI